MRLGWRQLDLSDKAGVSQAMISLVERGHLDRTSLRTMRRILGALDAGVELHVRWRAGDIDRVLDEGHARLVGAVARRLSAVGWEVVPEVTYARFGEYGSIDLVGWHAPSRTALVVEVKTELTSVERTCASTTRRSGWRRESWANGSAGRRR